MTGQSSDLLSLSTQELRRKYLQRAWLPYSPKKEWNINQYPMIYNICPHSERSSIFYCKYLPTLHWSSSLRSHLGLMLMYRNCWPWNKFSLLRYCSLLLWSILGCKHRSGRFLSDIVLFQAGLFHKKWWRALTKNRPLFCILISLYVQFYMINNQLYDGKGKVTNLRIRPILDFVSVWHFYPIRLSE